MMGEDVILQMPSLLLKGPQFSQGHPWYKLARRFVVRPIDEYSIIFNNVSADFLAKV